MIRHGGYFAAAAPACNRFIPGARADAPRHFGRSATNAAYVVLVMRLLSPTLCGHVQFRLAVNRHHQ